jgi:HSP20 family protein
MMTIGKLIPWNRNRSTALAPRLARDPILSLQRQVNRLFDELWSDFDMPALATGVGFGTEWPAVDLNETDKELVLTIEVPGMEEKDVEVQYVDGALVLRGERRGERGDGQRFSERYYGRFERRIPLDVEIDADKAKATLKNGVLTVTLPKTPQAQAEVHRIPVAKAA